MPIVWNRTAWVFSPITLSHTPTTLVKAFHSALTQSGYELADWAAAGDDRTYFASERGVVDITNNAVGVAGNVGITKSGATISVTGMSGGTVSTKAAGSVSFNRNPEDGYTVTIGDGTLTKTFEFDSAAAAQAAGLLVFFEQPVDGAQIVLNDGVNPAVTFEFDSNSSVTQTATLRQVVIGGSLATTVTNLITAINSGAYTLAITASASTGTGVTSNVHLVNDSNGTAGNQTITTTGTNIKVVGMEGGRNTPAFTGGNTQVLIGENRLVTMDAFIAAIANSGLAVKAVQRTVRWRYNGDGTEQNCGIRVRYNSGNARLELSAVIEGTTQRNISFETPSSQIAYLAYSLTADNDLFICCGEEGLYYELGRDGLQTNLAHGAVVTFQPIASMYGTRDALTRRTSQGLVWDLFGTLRLSFDRNFRFVDTVGANKNHSGCLYGYAARGTTSLVTNAQFTGQGYYIVPRDNLLGLWETNVGSSAPNYYCSFGLAFTPQDDVYRVSPIWMRQHSTRTDVAVQSSSGSNNVVPTSLSAGFYDPRWLREFPRFYAVDPTLIPWTQITEPISNKSIRIAAVADAGRDSRIGIEYPTTVITVPATPTV